MKPVFAYPSTIHRLTDKEIMANLPGISEASFIDIDMITYNDFTSAGYWERVFNSKMPADCIYQALELYSYGIKPKELKQKIKAGKIKRPDVSPDKLGSFTVNPASLEQSLCLSVGGYHQTFPRVVCP
jgi:hypothetical protein